MNKRLLCLMAALLLAGATLASAATPGPVSWWKLDEMSGATTADAITGDTGDIAGTPTWVPGQLDGALSFDGSTNFVTLPIGSLIASLSDTTVTTWADFSNAGGAWQRLWDFGSGTGVYMFLCARVNTDGVIRFAIRTASVGEQIVNTPDKLASGWHNIAVSIDSQAMMINAYVDGAKVASGPTVLLPKDLGVTTQNWLGKSQWPDALYQGSLDDVRIYDRVLTGDEIKNAMEGGIGYGIANTPDPADKAANMLPNIVLRWKPGQDSKTYDVYFGTSRNDVLNASPDNPMGVLLSAGQEATTYDAGRLAFGTTYYWRIDGIGAAPDFTVYKGNVWSFTVEPKTYKLPAASIKATASSVNNATMGPEKTIDGSGLVNGAHSTLETDMWLSKNGELTPWIQYEFDQVYALNEMLVWNSNQAMEPVVGYGLMNVTVEYSENGQDWATLDTLDFAQAPGEAGYTANTTVDFGGAAAKFVKLVVNSNWGGFLPQYGLSEVQFSYTPVKATQLTPVSGTINLDSPVTLSWRPGREAVSHEIYLGTDKDNLPLVATVDQPTYVANVSVGNLYYWKIVEVNEAETPARWESGVANFRTVAVPTKPDKANLTHQWTFNDGTAADSVGGVDGVLVGGASIVDGALVTSAQDQWMEMDGKAIAINTYDAFSCVVWYTPKAGANTGYSMLAYFGDSLNGFGSNGFFMCSARGDNVSRVGISCGNTSAPWSAESGANGPEIDDGKPHMMVGTIDATTIKLYIDGKLISSAALSATNKISALSTNFAYLAKGGYTGDPEWLGSIHEFSIYNKALTPGEVLYLANLMPKDPGTANLTHQWTFDDGTANDSVGGLNGTLVGGAAVVDGSLVTSAQDQWMEMDGKALAINTYEAFSIAGWYTPKAGANTGYHMLCYFGDSLNGFGSNGFFFTPARGDNVSRAGISCGNTSAPWSAETGVNGKETDDGNPHFVVATIDATNITLFMDGEYVGTATLSAANKISALSNNFAYLAKGGYTGDPEWLGSIQEFRIYDKALNISEVRFLAGAK